MGGAWRLWEWLCKGVLRDADSSGGKCQAEGMVVT